MSRQRPCPPPARAIRCAFAITKEIRHLGLEIRAGLHTGEIELTIGAGTVAQFGVAAARMAYEDAGLASLARGSRGRRTAP